MPKRVHLAYIGAILLDKIYSLQKLPSSGEGVVVEESITRAGGCAYNSAVIAQACGAEVSLLAPLGSGQAAQELESLLEAYGVDAWRVASEDDNGTCMCLVEPSGERSMITVPGIERNLNASWYEDIPDTQIALWDALAVSGYELAGASGGVLEDFLDRVRAVNPACAFWFAPGPSCEEISRDTYEHMAALRSFWHMNGLESEKIAEFLELTTQEVSAEDIAAVRACEGAGDLGGLHFGTNATAQESFLQHCCALASFAGKDIVITAGSAGAYSISRNKAGCQVLFVASKAVRVLDTIGAGDAHLGALMVAHASNSASRNSLEKRASVLEGLKHQDECPVEKPQLEFANQWAAEVCQSYGSLPSYDSLQALAKSLCYGMSKA